LASSLSRLYGVAPVMQAAAMEIMRKGRKACEGREGTKKCGESAPQASPRHDGVALCCF